jgi:hypothetical protein
VENEKIPEKFYYRIGEIADHLKVNTSLLRFWEKEFERFIRPDRNKRGSGYIPVKNLMCLSKSTPL